MTATIALPAIGASIQIASDVFGRVNGEWREATVVSVDEAHGLFEAHAEKAGLEDETLSVWVSVESDMWRPVAKGKGKG